MSFFQIALIVIALVAYAVVGLIVLNKLDEDGPKSDRFLEDDTTGVIWLLVWPFALALVAYRKWDGNRRRIFRHRTY